jgi:ADP-ribose pyrophosphatase YjhB (NUDIX family)
MPKAETPPIQLIANLVVRRRDGKVLLTRAGADDRWWLPGDDLEPYEHPDEAARRVLGRFPGLSGSLRLAEVESFRGRRGWHVVFHYAVAAKGRSGAAGEEGWHPADALPPTAHGRWEREVVRRTLEAGRGATKRPGARGLP